MQDAISIEREAMERLPRLLGDLLDEPTLSFQREQGDDSGVDAIADVRGRRWLFQVKSSSRPGIVAAAADQLGAQAPPDARAILVVPFMTSAGAKTAAERGLNWLDLSGNAHIRDDDLYIWVHGRPNQFVARGRPSSPFAPKSSRIARTLLLDPERWWRQKELAATTDLDDGHVSRIVHRLSDERLLENRASELRPLDPALLLDAWSDEYDFDRHDIVVGHMSGAGIELTRQLHHSLDDGGIEHAFTGLPAAWLVEPFARFRVNTVYVEGDPRVAAETIGLRRNERGANVQIVGPNDRGVFAGQHLVGDLPCVSTVQLYLDLLALPERSDEAAAMLRDRGLLWNAR
jgi:hypothetical protein